MKLKSLEQNWNALGKEDPYWAVLTNPAKKNNKWEPREFFKTGETHFENILKRLYVSDQLGSESALDFGCGPGRISQAMCRSFKKVVGVDISASMIEQAKLQNNYPDQCTYKVNTANDLTQFPDNSFDLVFSYITLQHIHPQYSVNYIREFIRVTKPGAFIIFNLPTDPPLYHKLLVRCIGNAGINLLRKIYYGKKWVMEMHWVKEASVQKLVDDRGCEIIRAEDDQGLGKGWKSKLYLIRKKA